MSASGYGSSTGMRGGGMSQPYGTAPAPLGGAPRQTLAGGSTPPAGYSGIYNPLDPGVAKAGPSIMPQGNWQQPSGGLLGNSQYAGWARGNSADQAQLVGAVGQDQAHQLNQYYGPGGLGFNPTGYGTGTADLAAGNYGVNTLTQQQRDLYTQNGIIGPDGKWLKRQDDSGNWVPIGGSVAPPANTAPSVLPPSGGVDPTFGQWSY